MPKFLHQRAIYCFFSLLFILPFTIFSQININLNKVEPTCNGYSNGSITTSISGGVSPYTYSWSNGSTSNQIQGIGSGNYSLTVKDKNGLSGNVSTTLNQPAVMVVTHSFANICVNGQTTLNVTGGTAPYTYAWSNGNTNSTATLSPGAYTVNVTDKNGCNVGHWLNVAAPLTLNPIKIVGLRCFGDCDASVEAITNGGTAPFTYLWNNGATTQVVPNLPSGTYSVTVKDANNCQVSGTTTINNPLQINLTVSKTNPGCGTGGSNNGTATATATGGNGPYTYDWSNGQRGSTATGLSAGSYSVTVTDAFGCKKTESVSLASATTYTISASTTSNASCGGSNGSASVTVNGNTGPYTYKWSNNATTQNLSNIAPGTYTVTVSDVNGCQVVSSTTVGTTGNLAISIAKTDAACGIANGTATVSVTTGTAPYTYLWSNNLTTNKIDLLNAGTYSVTVKDASNCIAIQSVTVGQGTSLTINADVTNPACSNSNNGIATVMILGGSAPYTYSWSNNMTTPSITNLSPGNYTVTVRDAAGCSSSKQVTITAPSAITLAMSATQPTCGGAKGAATVSVNGGTAPYSYAWSNNSGNSNTISNLNAGTFTVTVTDSKNCTSTSSATINASSGGFTTTINTNKIVSAQNSNDGELEALTSATGSYTYNWSNGKTTKTISGLAPGTYTVTVTDAGGCTSTATATLIAPPACNNVTSPGAIEGNVTYCPGQAIAEVVSLAPATGGSGTLNYIWMRSNVFAPTTATNWSVIQFANGDSYTPPQNITDTLYFVRCAIRQYCNTVSETNIVAYIPAVVPKLVTNRTKACLNTNITLEAVNNGTGATYIWNFGINSNPIVVSGRTATTKFSTMGPQSVSVQFFKNGCVATLNMIINVTSDPDCGTALVSNVNLNLIANQEVKLDWTTLNENDNTLFDIMRSKDGKDFESIQTILGKKGTLNSYTYTDEKPIHGKIYYQIKATTQDGNIEFSDMMSTLLFNSTENYLIYPNPVVKELNFDLMRKTSGEMDLEIVNTQGRIMRNYKGLNANDHQNFDLQDLNPGIYFIYIRFEGKLETAMKFIKK